MNIENVSILNVISIIYFFLPLMLKNSKIAAIVFINGLLCHCNIHINEIFYYDYICNFFIIIYKNYYNPEIRMLSLLGSSIATSNIILFRKYRYNRYIADIIHIMSHTLYRK